MKETAEESEPAGKDLNLALGDEFSYSNASIMNEQSANIKIISSVLLCQIGFSASLMKSSAASPFKAQEEIRLGDLTQIIV